MSCLQAFAGFDAGMETMLDRTTVCKFRAWLLEVGLAERLKEMDTSIYSKQAKIDNPYIIKNHTFT